MEPEYKLPQWYKGCQLTVDWCEYKGKVYFAIIDYEASEKKQKPVFDLAYCATQGLNGIFLKTGVLWNSKLFNLNPKQLR